MNEMKDCQAEDIPRDVSQLVLESLAPLRASPDFEKRCEDAALLAFSIEKLRRARELRSFFPIEIAQYFQRLAQYADVRLNSVLEWAGIRDLRPAAEEISGIARLMQTVGFSLEEAIIFLRVSVGAENGRTFLPSRVAFHGEDGPSDEIAGTCLALDEMEADYSPALKKELDDLLALLRAEYSRG